MFAAARGAGRPVASQTFTTSGTFVVPSNVTRINISGFGGPATPDVPVSGVEVTSAIAYANPGAPSGPFPPYARWEDLEASTASAGDIIALNSGTNLLTLPYISYSISSDGSYEDNSGPGVVSAWITGSSATEPQYNNHPSSGNILYSQVITDFPLGYGWLVFADSFDIGEIGTPASAIGQSFPGGTLSGTEPFRTAVPATTTTYNNIAVTPSASYSIFVPSGGTVTIIYIG